MNSKRHILVSDVDLNGNERRYLLEAFDSGWISGSGPFVDRFEEAFAQFIGVDHAVSCANGTVALHLALLALGVGPGDEVIVPSLTYIATANAVSYCGATPVFADCDLDTWNISLSTIQPLVTERTKCIVVVHLFGNPVDMSPIMEFSRNNGLYVVEDAAEAHGAEYQGQRTGSVGDISVFSFYGNKLMTTGEGGMVAINHDELVSKVRRLRGQGMDLDKRYWFPIIGYNYRLTNLQCAIGLAQLERFPEFIASRQALVQKYRKLFSGDLPLRFQKEQSGGTSAWWMFCVVMESRELRDRVIQSLEDRNIETRPIFYPLHMMPPYQESNAKCPHAERIGLGGVCLPSGSHVKDSDSERIVAAVIETVKNR